MNILFFLTPKSNCEYLSDDESLREALERMELAGFSALPIVGKQDGVYKGTLTEGDLLWAIKNQCQMSLTKAQMRNIMEIHHHHDYVPVTVSTDISNLMQRAVDQNFVPVVDDRNTFIGIVTRRTILRHYLEAQKLK